MQLQYMEHNTNAQMHATKNKPLQLDCLTRVKPHPFSSLNASAVGLLLLFLELRRRICMIVACPLSQEFISEGVYKPLSQPFKT